MQILKTQLKFIVGQLFIYGIFALLLLSSACEKEATVKIPETAPKPVLTCFLSPEDSFITVRLTNSIPLYSGTSAEFPYEIKNAEIILSSEQGSIIVPWFRDSIGYRISATLFQILPGKEYQLKVNIPDGRKLSASTTVPEKIFPPVTLSIEKQLTDSNEYFVSYNFTNELSWTDMPGEGDYYRGTIASLFVDTFLTSDTMAQILQEIFEQDKGKDASNIKLVGTGSLSYTPGTASPFANNLNIAYLILSDQSYYDYHKDLWESNEANPFSEAKINYSNVIGGIGCFGSYRMVKKRF